MRNKDSTQQNEDDIPTDEDLDFDIISRRKQRKEESDTTDSDNESNEQCLTPLQDRTVSTITVGSITTESNTVSGTTLSSQLGAAVEHISSIDEVVTVDTHSAVQQAELDTVTKSNQGSSDADEEEVLPNHIQTTGTSLATEILHDKVTNLFKPREETTYHVDSLGTTQLETLTTDNRSTSYNMTLSQSQTGNQPEQEIEEFDPAYQWSGGNPYESTTPQCIIHIDNNDTESLPFLQRVLRDTYTELEGGRPRTKTATVRVGSIENTTIHGAIVTLDLTTKGWTVSTEDQQIRINHDGQDMIPELRSIVSTLYGGKLGYFVINVDLDDIQSRFISDEIQELVRTLLPATDSYDSITSNELLQQTAAPIRLAVPRSESESEFMQIVKRYFSLKNIDQSRIADLEAEHEARLRASDWRRIALTQQQESSDGESDEHYLWKAAMTAGIAWEMYEEYSVLEEEISFDKFVETQLIPSDLIQSESSDEPTDTIPDVELTVSKVWAWNGLRHYLSETNTEPPKDSQVILEFETGRAEGAFNFRKFYHSLDKYSERSNVWIYLVIPPRILFRSKSRAYMINQLITRWESCAQSGQHAELCIPILGQYGCDRLISAESLITEWFGDINE